jgi:hypothetical protein
MSEIKDDGPAFPVHRDYEAFNPGMTLRDYFAAKAMQGLLAAQVHGFNDRPAKGPFASMAYEMADAMLKARGS